MQGSFKRQSESDPSPSPHPHLATTTRVNIIGNIFIAASKASNQLVNEEFASLKKLTAKAGSLSSKRGELQRSCTGNAEGDCL